MANGTTDEDVCRTAVEISRHPLVSLLLSLTTLSCLIGFATTVLLAHSLVCRPVYHINIRLLLWSMCVALGGLSVGVGYLSAEHLYLFVRYWHQPCEMAVDHWWCLLQRQLALIVPQFIVAVGGIGFAVERSYATRHYRTYDLNVSKRIAICLIALQWLVGVSLPVVSSKTNEALVGSAPYCISLLLVPDAAIKGMMLIFGLNFTSFLIAMMLFSVNSKKRRLQVGVETATANGGHLSGRYQLGENLKTTRMLTPSLFGHVLVNAGCTLLVITINRRRDDDMVNLVVLNECLSLLLSLYASIFCVTCIVQSPQLWSHVRQRWMGQSVSSMEGDAVPANDDTAYSTHFQQLTGSWMTKWEQTNKVG